jgi:hypothetical protein
MSVLVLTAAIVVGAPPVLRSLLACWFLLACPGLALVPLLRLGSFLGTWTVAIATSVALDTVVVGAMLYAGAWSPAIAFLVLAAITVGGAFAQLIGSREGVA